MRQSKGFSLIELLGQVRRCPSYRPFDSNSYGLNELVFVDLTEPAATLRPVLTLAAVQTPTATVMMAELGTADDFITPQANAFKSTAPSSVINDDADARPAARHSLRANLGLMDGHQKAYRLDQFYTKQTPVNLWYSPDGR